jgi:hypothetical protein
MPTLQDPLQSPDSSGHQFPPRQSTYYDSPGEESSSTDNGQTEVKGSVVAVITVVVVVFLLLSIGFFAAHSRAQQRKRRQQQQQQAKKLGTTPPTSGVTDTTQTRQGESLPAGGDGQLVGGIFEPTREHAAEGGHHLAPEVGIAV